MASCSDCTCRGTDEQREIAHRPIRSEIHFHRIELFKQWSVINTTSARAYSSIEDIASSAKRFRSVMSWPACTRTLTKNIVNGRFKNRFTSVCVGKGLLIGWTTATRAMCSLKLWMNHNNLTQIQHQQYFGAAVNAARTLTIFRLIGRKSNGQIFAIALEKNSKRVKYSRFSTQCGIL